MYGNQIRRTNILDQIINPSDDTIPEEKRICLELTYDWLRGIIKMKHHREMRIGGGAGVGKTRMLKYQVELCKKMGLRYAVVAFTNKAVSVLRTNGIPEAQTMHTILYRVYTNSYGEICYAKRDVIFYDVVFVDEGSMVSTSLYNDLCNHRTWRVIVGDPMQLSPVGDDPRLMEEVDFILEEIHRQGKESPIIAFAHRVRHGNLELRPGHWGNDQVGHLEIITQMPQDLRPYDIVICSYNNTRHRLNNEKRQSLGYASILEEGETIMCLKNARNGLYNSLFVTASNITITPSVVTADLTDSLGMVFENIRMNAYVFGRNYEVGTDDINETLPFSYASAITTHKSQASQWGSVIIKNEKLKNSDYARRLYTAATRAEFSLTIAA